MSNEKKKAYRKSWYKSLHFLIWLKRKKEGILKNNNENSDEDNKTKVIYGKENLREIITNLLEEKFNEIIEQCEN